MAVVQKPVATSGLSAGTKSNLFLGLVAAGIILGAVYVTNVATGTAHTQAQAWNAGERAFSLFGLLAVVAMWLISAALTGSWNILALAMGDDGRLSTSKMQALLWTATVGFVYVTIYVDRLMNAPGFSPFYGIPNNVLIALGISVTTVVAAKTITSSQITTNPDSKSPQQTSYDLSALVRNDGKDVASLTKVQMLFWTLVAIVAYVFVMLKNLAIITGCSSDACTIPDIDTSLMVLMGLGHATYLGSKLATGNQPLLSTASAAIAAGGFHVTLSGSNLGAAGSLTMNGSAIQPANLSWTPTAIGFDLPPKVPAWATGDSAVFAVVVGVFGPASVTLKIP